MMEKTATLDEYYAFVERPENAVSPSFTPSAIAARIIFYLTATVMKHHSGYITVRDLFDIE